MTDLDSYQLPLPATLQYPDGREISRPTAERLAEDIELLDAFHEWISCSPAPDRDGHFIQTVRLPGGAYEVETREGIDTEIATRRLPDGDAVLVAFLDQIRSWATDPERVALPTGPVPQIPIEPAARQYAEEVATTAVAAGNRTFPEVVLDLVESAEPGEVTAVQARRLLQPIWDAQLAMQSSWDKGTSDNDRLDAAFAALEAAGITARQDFACCQSCGTSEIGAEREDARGYVFYHQQDTTAAAAGGGLYLAYGTLDDAQVTTASVGQEVVAALAGAGLAPVWDGDLGTRILVPMRWRRRLPAPAAPIEPPSTPIKEKGHVS